MVFLKSSIAELRADHIPSSADSVSTLAFFARPSGDSTQLYLDSVFKSDRTLDHTMLTVLMQTVTV
jgi:hypothetical protein